MFGVVLTINIRYVPKLPKPDGLVTDPDCVLSEVGIAALCTYSLDKCQFPKG